MLIWASRRRDEKLIKVGPLEVPKRDNSREKLQCDGRHDGLPNSFCEKRPYAGCFDNLREDRRVILRESRLPSEWLPGATRLTSGHRISLSPARNKLALS